MYIINITKDTPASFCNPLISKDQVQNNYVALHYPCTPCDSCIGRFTKM